jgi:hypothetical protein
MLVHNIKINRRKTGLRNKSFMGDGISEVTTF